VQTVLVVVISTVEVEALTEVSTLVTPPVVWVVIAVTGQTVVEVSMTTVVITSLGVAEVVL
jgi:hypothetical protein